MKNGFHRNFPDTNGLKISEIILFQNQARYLGSMAK